MTPSTHPSQRRIKHPRVYLLLPMALGLFFQCTWKWRRKMTRGWLNAGKRMRTGSSSLCVAIYQAYSFIHAKSSVIDWIVLCCCRLVDLSVNSGHSTEPTRHLQFLPREYLSSRNQPKWTQYIEYPPHFPTPVLSTKLCSLGQRALVHELGDQPYLCFACDISPAMGSKIPQSYPLALPSTQASTAPYILFRRCRKVSPSMGGRCIADTPPHFPVPILRRSGCALVEREYFDFQIGVVMGRPLHGSVRMHHTHANLSSR